MKKSQKQIRSFNNSYSNTNTTQMSAFKSLLESTIVDSLPTPKGKVIVIDSQSTLIKGFEVYSLQIIDQY